MNVGVGYGFHTNAPVDGLNAIPAQKRSWRMKQELKAYQLASEADAILERECHSSNQEAKFQGLALLIRAHVEGAGYYMQPPEMFLHATATVVNILADPKNFTQMDRPGGGSVRTSCLRPGDYIILSVAEAMVFAWVARVKPDRTGRWRALWDALPPPPAALAHAREVCERCLIRMAGDSSTTRVGASTPAPGASNSGIANLMALQLTQYNLHLDHLKWVAYHTLFDACKASDLSTQPPAVKEQLQRAGAGLAALATWAPPAPPAAPSIFAPQQQQQQPEDDQSSGLGCSPGVAPVMEEAVATMLRANPVSQLRQQAAVRQLDTSACIEKEDLVQLLKAAVLEERAAQQAGQPAGTPLSGDDTNLEDMGVPAHADLSAWSPMALFLQAEANDLCVGRTYQVQDMFRAAVAAARGSSSSSSSSSSGAAAVSCPGDEMYGWLAAWNLLLALSYGGSPFRLGEVLEVMAWAGVWRDSMKSWHGNDWLAARIKIIAPKVVNLLKGQLAAARERPARQASALAAAVPSNYTLPPAGQGSTAGTAASSSSSSGGAVAPPSAEAWAKARAKLGAQPGEESLVLVPADPSLEAVVGDATQAEDLHKRQCCSCQKYTLDVRSCSACKGVRYCSKECQKAHWPAHKEECRRTRAQQGAAQ